MLRATQRVCRSFIFNNKSSKPTKRFGNQSGSVFSVMSISNSSSNSSIRCISPEQAAAIDMDLMSPEVGFRLEQLMELAGLSCAAAVSRVYPRDKYSRVLVVAGPGNNGGDALVAARHLHHFGYKPHVIYPKTTHNTLYLTLLAQLKYMRVPVSEQFTEQSLHEHDVVLDGIFGFSFKGEVRAPFDTVLKSLNSSALPIVSIDIPSGWDVTQGNVSGQGLTRVDLLVSLTAPKPCAKLFKGTHYLGGRFIPDALRDKYQLSIPAYSGAEQCVDITHCALVD